MTVDILLEALTEIALRLEKEANDASLSDNLISVRHRAQARATLSTVQYVLGDDWLVESLAATLRTKDTTELLSNAASALQAEGYPHDHELVAGLYKAAKS